MWLRYFYFFLLIDLLISLGIPGVKDSLLQEFGIRLLTYDLPGFGESDPHPNRNLETSAMDMAFLADALGVDRFWVVGYSSGSMHAWSALRYIPDRLAGIGCPFCLSFTFFFFFLKFGAFLVALQCSLLDFI